MTLLNPRILQNKPGYPFVPANSTRIYAEDYQVFVDTFRNAGSEVFPWIYNVTTAQRNALPTARSGLLIFNTDIGSLQTYDGVGWQSIGSSSFNYGTDITIAGSFIGAYGSFNTTVNTGSVITGVIITKTINGLNFYAADGITLLMRLDNNGDLGLKGAQYSL